MIKNFFKIIVYSLIPFNAFALNSSAPLILEEEPLPIVVKCFNEKCEGCKELPLKLYAECRVEEDFGSEHWKAFERVIQKESSWKVTGYHYEKKPVYKNGEIIDYRRKSSAFGLAGFLDATWSTVGCKQSTDPYIQVDCALKYIKARYGNPEKALAFHNQKNYY